MRRIQVIVARTLGAHPAIMTQKNRGCDPIPWFRQLAMHFCYRYKFGCYQYIGDRFGGREHATVQHAFTTVRDTIDGPGETMRKRQYQMCLEKIVKAFGPPP